MKHLNIIIIILLFLSSCIDKPKNGIEGDWIGYERTFVLDEDTLIDNFHIILSIDKDSIRAVNFKYITHGNRDSLSKASYTISENDIIVSNESESADTLTIDVLNENTLILSTSKNKYKYSRLLKLKTETEKIELTEKIFTISDSIQIIDTIEFLNDSSILTYNSKLQRPNQIYNWRFRDYFGYSFLIIDSPEIPVFLIKRDVENDFLLKREPNDFLTYYLKNTTFESKLTFDELIGKWTGKSNRPENTLNFIFDKDSVQMNEFTGGEMVTAIYSLNLNRTKMFCFHKYASENIFYEIDKIKNDSMYLKRLAPIRDSFVLTRIK